MLSLVVAGLLVVLSCGDAGDQAPGFRPDTTNLLVGLSVGSEDPIAEGSFGSVVDVLACPGGRVAVLDRLSAEVLVYGRDGQLERKIGSRGPGPGELLEPFDMGLSESGLLFVSDVSGLHVFDWPSGDWLGVKQELSRPMLVDLNGVDGHFLTARRIEWDTSSGEPIGTISYARYDTTGSRDVIYYSEQIGADYDSRYYETLIDPYEAFGDESGRVFVSPVSTDAILVRGFEADGSQFMEIRREITPVPKSSRELSDEKEFFEWFYEQMEMNIDFEPVEHRRTVSGLGVDSLGRLWVHVSLDTVPVFEIYGSTGELVEIASVQEIWGAQALWEFSINRYGVVGYCEDPVQGAQTVLVLRRSEE